MTVAGIMAVVDDRVVKRVIVSYNLMIQAVVSGLLPFSKRHFLQIVSYVTIYVTFPYH